MRNLACHIALDRLDPYCGTTIVRIMLKSRGSRQPNQKQQQQQQTSKATATGTVLATRSTHAELEIRTTSRLQPPTGQCEQKIEKATRSTRKALMRKHYTPNTPHAPQPSLSRRNKSKEIIRSDVTPCGNSRRNHATVVSRDRPIPSRVNNLSPPITAGRAGYIKRQK